jgi:hypothetical protein
VGFLYDGITVIRAGHCREMRAQSVQGCLHGLLYGLLYGLAALCVQAFLNDLPDGLAGLFWLQWLSGAPRAEDARDHD